MFPTEDIYGKSISIPVKNKKTLLCFMRFAGCPVCNLRVHELLKNADKFEAKNIQVILVYESGKETMLEYLQNENFPFVFISDKENKLYNLYSVEKSFRKLMSGMFHGAMGKAISGKKLFRKAVPVESGMTRMNAEFLIDEKGKIDLAHYSDYFGDELSIQKILG